MTSATTESAVSKPTPEEMSAYSTLARKSLDNQVDLTRKAIAENKEFASIAKASPDSLLQPFQESVIGVQFAIASAFIHSWISTNTPLHLSDMDLRFKADVWGIGIGGGVVWLNGWLAPADQLLGDVKFLFTTSMIHTEIAFSKNGSPLGVLVGGGLNVQSGCFAGTGTFSKW